MFNRCRKYRCGKYQQRFFLNSGSCQLLHFQKKNSKRLFLIVNICTSYRETVAEQDFWIPILSPASGSQNNFEKVTDRQNQKNQQKCQEAIFMSVHVGEMATNKQTNKTHKTKQKKPHIIRFLLVK